jgi:hypothetical protein
MGSWPEGVPLPSKPEKPDSIEQWEWDHYMNMDPKWVRPELRDKIERAMGWKDDDTAAAQEIAERVLGAVSLHDMMLEPQPILPKGHVPEANLLRYRGLARLARQLKSLGDTIGPNDMEDSTILWRMAKKYRDKANELRVDLPHPRGGLTNNPHEEKQ